MSATWSIGVAAAERGLLPDAWIRVAIRSLARRRLKREETASSDRREAFLETMRAAEIALVPEKANEQHYEVPAAFFERVLGPHLKYSCGFWPEGVTDLAGAEAESLRVTSERAGLADGQDVLELGCGWGSLTLWMAEHYPSSRITAVSNSASQRELIEGRARERGLENVRVVTADMNGFEPGGVFDRVVSVEMFEHMRNWERLLERVASWLRPGGRLFVHVFAHRRHAYAFEGSGPRDWMTRHFFTGGIMPDASLLGSFDEHLRVARHWWWDGGHYARTAEAWLRNLDARRDEILPVLAETYGPRDAGRWFRRWRLFFLACAEIFGFRGGTEWGVAHALLEPRPRSDRR
jgi:cyclopropane-fatty-acyl-phospholipid synthase